MGKGKGPEKGRNLEKWRSGYDDIDWKKKPTPIDRLRIAAQEFVELNGDALLKASQNLHES